MSIFKEFNYSEKSVNKVVIDANSGEFLWIAFSKGTNNKCSLKKVSAHDPSQVYFDVDVDCEEITAMIKYGSYLFLGVDHANNYLLRYSLFNPITLPTEFTFPSGVTESPVSVVSGGTYLWWLTPGNSSGENAKIIKTNSVGTFQETIDLNISALVVNSASSLIYDNGDLWVVTNENPLNLYRVYYDASWIIQETEIS